MAAMNSAVLACNYAISGAGSSELNAKLASMPSVASPVGPVRKLPVIRAQQATVSEPKESKRNEGRRAALLCLTATLFTTAAAAASNSSATAGVIEEYLEKSKANKVCYIGYSLKHLLPIVTCY
jgi:photosystem I subunit PsaN